MPGLGLLHANAEFVGDEDLAFWALALFEVMSGESLAYGHLGLCHLAPSGPVLPPASPLAKEAVTRGSVVGSPVVVVKHY